MQDFAILGSTASGKTALAVNLAKKFNAVILSLDSLSIYKEIDIASAKPSLEERGEIKHFGIDVIKPNQNFNVVLFFELYKEAKNYAKAHNKSLIIVGGTSFYLRSMLTGLNEKPLIQEQTKLKVKQALQEKSKAYSLMLEKDELYAKNISQNDTYRIEKWLEIYYETSIIPSEYFKLSQKKPIIEKIKIYNILTDKEDLRQRIEKRTKKMIELGLIDEVVMLEKTYGRSPRAMGAIGIKEVLGYLDGEFDIKQMYEKIVTNTARLAKRQRTFNKSQFKDFGLVDKSLEEFSF